MKILPRDRTNIVEYGRDKDDIWEFIYYIVTDKEGNKFRKVVELIGGELFDTRQYPISKETALFHENEAKELL